MATAKPLMAHCALCKTEMPVQDFIEIGGFPLCSPCLTKKSKDAALRQERPRFYKIVEGKEIAGVCGGLADKMNMDRDTLRVLVALADLMTGIVPMLIGYIVLAAILPTYDDSQY